MNRLSLLSALALLAFVYPTIAQDIVAHRGASHDAPENTLAAFHLAWEQGADAIEGDFMLSQDGRIVCFHDNDLKRLTGDPRNVADVSLAELQTFDVGIWKSSQYEGTRIPTLEQVLAIVPDGKRLFLEIKCGPEILPPLQRALKNSPLTAAQVVIISFNEKVIAQCRQKLPQHEAHWLTSHKHRPVIGWQPTHEAILSQLEEIQASGLDTQANPDRITQTFVSRLRAAGYAFHCWTVNDPALARHFRELGVDSITTDRPAWLRKQLQQ